MVGCGGAWFLLFLTAVSGGALALAIMMFRKMPIFPVYAQAPWLLTLHGRKKDIPYGVAIAGGGVLSFSQTPFFQLVLGG